MKIESIDIEDNIKRVREMMEKEKNIPASLKMAIEILIFIVSALINRLKLNSSNSSKPPSSDGYKKQKRTKSQVTIPIAKLVANKVIMAKTYGFIVVENENRSSAVAVIF